MKPEYIERMVMTNLPPKSSSKFSKANKEEAFTPFVFKGGRQYPFNQMTK